MNKKELIKEIDIQVKHHKQELIELGDFALKTEVETITCCINSLKHIKECTNKLTEFRKIICNNNPLPTIKEQIAFGFTKEEAVQNLKDSEYTYYIKEGDGTSK